MAKVAGSNLSDFKRDLARWADEVDDLTLRKKKQAVRAIVTELVYSTPFVSGLTRSNWRASVGARTSAMVGIRSASATIDEAVSKVATARRNTTIFIANHVPWLYKLNRHSLQDAPGWIERAIARGVAVARSLARGR